MTHLKRILITGATGNVGRAILTNMQNNPATQVFKASYANTLNVDELYFNFDNLEKSKPSLENLDVLFLLRPPHISDTRKYFQPLINHCVESQVRHIVFLSVQGAERSSIIPHNRIEKMIVASGIPYTFIRPSYFMQNLITTLKADIKRGAIFLPAGNAKFLWVDVDDIGKVIAHVLEAPDLHQNKVYTITGSEYFTFGEVATLLSNAVAKEICYESPGLIKFYLRKKSEGVKAPYIMVMILLHFLARFEATPKVSSDIFDLTGHNPKTLREFILQHNNEFV